MKRPLARFVFSLERCVSKSYTPPALVSFVSVQNLLSPAYPGFPKTGAEQKSSLRQELQLLSNSAIVGTLLV